MAIFSKRASKDSIGEMPKVVLTKKDKHIKTASSEIHDPILTAIRDAQPFEVSNEHNSNAGLSPQGRYRDIFGNIITNPDQSNPTRLRDERPLDTIRAFEFAYTGDERLRDEMETQRLGWSTRRDFNPMPTFQSNPYASSAPPINVSSSGLNTSTFNGSHTRPLPEEKKPKRGFFGRKKK